MAGKTPVKIGGNGVFKKTLKNFQKSVDIRTEGWYYSQAVERHGKTNRKKHGETSQEASEAG